MQADHSRRSAAHRSRFVLAVVAIRAIWPVLLLAAEPVKPAEPVQSDPVQQAQPLAGNEPKRTRFVYAQYPELALRHGMSCAVTLRFTIQADGSTADVEVVHSDPVPLFVLFEESAVRAVQQWRYEPVIRNGKPVAETVEVRIRFAGTKRAFPETYDDPIEPLSAENMESVLRRDLERPLSSGVLSAGSPIGLAIGIVRDGERRVFTFGKATPDAMFEIGSVTKTFTGLLLAVAIERGQVRSTTPVRELLPRDTVAKPANGSEITLLDLVTQHSGLPRMPDNFEPKDPANPYADYDSSRLYRFMREHGVAKPVQPSFLYSNLGFGLLGQALANRANTDYPLLLTRAVLDPLGMRETTITLDADQQRRFMQGHDADRRPVPAWDLTALAGAGGLRSTAADLLTYLEANLQQRPAEVIATAGGRTLAAALVRSQTLQADAADLRKIAYAWSYDLTTQTYSHDGATGGFSSYAFFNPKRNYAGIALVNLTSGPRGNLAVMVGKHIDARFAGETALSLKDW